MKNTLGNWITNGSDTPFYVRKSIAVSKEVTRATAKVCGLGQFIFYVNGKKIDDHELDPGWTEYRKLIQYVVFDVTNEMKPGNNVIGAEIGNGWFIMAKEHYTFKFPDFMPPNPNPYKPYGKSLIFAIELRLEYADGTDEIIHGDSTFKVKAHPTIMSNVYGSETIDARLSQKGWNQAEFDDSEWENARIIPKEDEITGELQEQFQPPIKVLKTYDAKYLWTIEKKAGDTTVSREIYDFGQNISGILDVDIRGKSGDIVRFFPAEKLGEDGDADQVAKNWTTVDSCITYIVGEDDTWENCRMKFTYFAGRYMAVEKHHGSGIAQDEIKLRNFIGKAISSAWKSSGMFLSDDERYNKIYSMIERTVEANMVSVHTDCPTIERFAWQEPNHLMAPSIFFMKDGSMLWKKFLLDMRTQQHTASDFFLDFNGNKFYPGDGLMPSQCPCYIPNVLPVPGMGSFYDIIPWGSTCIIGTYWHYKFYGDKSVIEENYDSAMRYLRHLKSRVTKEGFINHGLGDWGHPKGRMARENVETVFLYADTAIMKLFADILGKSEDGEKLEACAKEIKENYNNKLLVKHPTEGIWCYRMWSEGEDFAMTQACEALPLYWGMVPKDKEEDVVRAFLITLEEEQAFVSGEVGLPYIIQTAGKYGMDSLIARYVTRESHPSYYAFIKDGMTTLGEYWENNPRSHCHDMMGHIMEWYYNGIAGIRLEAPGFKKVVIRPFLPEGMHEFKCVFHSVSGVIAVQVTEKDREILVETEISDDIEYSVNTDKLKVRNKEIVVKDGNERNY